MGGLGQASPFTRKRAMEAAVGPSWKGAGQVDGSPHFHWLSASPGHSPLLRLPSPEQQGTMGSHCRTRKAHQGQVLVKGTDSAWGQDHWQ